MDESAQNQRSEITLYTSNGVGLSVRQKHSYIHTLYTYIHVCLACVFFIFSQSSATNVRGISWRAATISATNSTNSGTRGKLGVRYYLRGLPRGSTLAVWLPETETECLWNHFYVSVLCLCSGVRTCWWLCGWYLAVINSSSPHCLIGAFTLTYNRDIPIALPCRLNFVKCLLHVISLKIVHKNISIIREVVCGFLNPH